MQLSGNKRKPYEPAEDGHKGGDRCDVEVVVDLVSVDMGAIGKVQVGDLLDVYLILKDGYDAVGCRRPSTREHVGAIAGIEELQILVDCLRRNVSYRAETLRLSGATCTVRIARDKP